MLTFFGKFEVKCSRNLQAIEISTTENTEIFLAGTVTLLLHKIETYSKSIPSAL